MLTHLKRRKSTRGCKIFDIWSCRTMILPLWKYVHMLFTKSNMIKLWSALIKYDPTSQKPWWLFSCIHHHHHNCWDCHWSVKNEKFLSICHPHHHCQNLWAWEMRCRWQNLLAWVFFHQIKPNQLKSNQIKSCSGVVPIHNDQTRDEAGGQGGQESHHCSDAYEVPKRMPPSESICWQWWDDDDIVDVTVFFTKV